MYVSHDPQNTRTLQNLTRLLELQNMKSSTVVLPNAGHDHLRNFAFSLRKKSRSPYAVVPTGSVNAIKFKLACSALSHRCLESLAVCRGVASFTANAWK